jgi:hypothetical protein
MVPEFHFGTSRVKVTCHKKKINMGGELWKPVEKAGRFPFWELLVRSRDRRGQNGLWCALIPGLREDYLLEWFAGNC